MPPIYPSTALKDHQREIKSLADHEVVYITENGRGKYVFMSQEVMQRQIDDAVEQALYEHRLHEALDESRKDFQTGKYYTSREDLMAAVAQKRAGRAKA
ncbi:MAG: hypothetical protein ACI4B6_04940 [Atopobiaceae bacterium]